MSPFNCNCSQDQSFVSTATWLNNLDLLIWDHLVTLVCICKKAFVHGNRFQKAFSDSAKTNTEQVFSTKIVNPSLSATQLLGKYFCQNVICAHTFNKFVFVHVQLVHHLKSTSRIFALIVEIRHAPLVEPCRSLSQKESVSIIIWLGFPWVTFTRNVAKETVVGYEFSWMRFRETWSHGSLIRVGTFPSEIFCDCLSSI